MKKKVFIIIISIFLLYYNTNIFVEADETIGEETANDLFQLYNRETLKGIHELKQTSEHPATAYNAMYSTVLSGALITER